ncbi:DUF6221 family protein [Streptomyces sp. ID03-2B]|uniref:DUF6221 family protein n=1 Tax=Streptomyces sp. ID03-2B TaxID=3028660 RepID=UPI0039F68070
MTDGQTADFRQGKLSGFHSTITLHDPARVLREVEAKRRVLARTQPCHGRPRTTVGQP